MLARRAPFSIRNISRTRTPRVPFATHHQKVLGKNYELSLAFVTPHEAKRLNRHYRNKSYIPNILSFPLSKSAGEIVMCPAEMKRQAKATGEVYAAFVERLFIHGLLHLKGQKHGKNMRSAERRLVLSARQRKGNIR